MHGKCSDKPAKVKPKGGLGVGEQARLSASVHTHDCLLAFSAEIPAILTPPCALHHSFEPLEKVALGKEMKAQGFY